MGKILVIVESPGKIKKLQAILGDKYLVMASVGHILDLDPKKMSVDIENNFEPTYKIIAHGFSDKNKVVADLKKAAAKADEILLAADEDREGEMIAWSVATVLDLNIKKAKRIAFNSITKSELEKAISKPRTIDMNLVDAQKARRILDRIIGYQISPILWKSIGASLSAGRVQSVVIRLIIDKENEINNFLNTKQSNNYFKINGLFQLDKTKNNSKNFTAQLFEKIINQKKIKYEKAKLDSESKARDIMKLFTKSEFAITDIKEKDSVKNPSPPFTTSTLVQESSRKLGFTIKRTNSAAQKLYEAGYITYMRTDSVNLSNEALENIKKYVLDKYGKEYLRSLNYESKLKNTQEAHEACRPTDVFTEFIKEGGKNKEVKIGNDEVKLYSLIWKRTVASQMMPAKIKITDIIIDASKLKDYSFITQISIIAFAGFLSVYNLQNVEKEDPEQDSEQDPENTSITETDMLDIKIPKIGTKININNIICNQEYEKPPSRYNEASLVNKLDPKNLNIGRPSTYASIINTIQERNYVIMGDIEGIEKDSITMSWDGKSTKINEVINKIRIGKETNKLIPTSLGNLVTDFLIKHFKEILDYQFTALMEEALDKIAEGEIVWHKVLDTFYKKFKPIVQKLLDSKSTLKSEMTRVLGKHPTLEHEIVATIARFGPVIKMCSSKTKCIYAPIKEPLTRDTITLEQALKLLEYPKDLGKYEAHHIMLNTGKHGLYITWGDIKTSIENKEEPENKPENKNQENKPENKKPIIKLKNPSKITFEEAVEIIKNKRKNVLWEKVDGKNTIVILVGPYGNYIEIKEPGKKIKKKPLRVSMPKDFDNTKIPNLTIDDVQELIKKGLESKANRFKKKDKNTGEKEEKPKTVRKLSRSRAPVKKTSRKTSRKPSKKPVKKTTKKKILVDKKIKISKNKKN